MGISSYIMPTAQDHKRAYDGDKGPNNQVEAMPVPHLPGRVAKVLTAADTIAKPVLNTDQQASYLVSFTRANFDSRWIESHRVQLSFGDPGNANHLASFD